MLIYILFVIGIFLLLKGAGVLVDGSAALAKKIGVPTLAIGLTVVAFGTSLPELIVNLTASFKENGDIAFGNIVGSNIANVLLILGITAIIKSLKIQHSTVWKEIPFSLLAVIVLFIFTNISFLDNLNFTYIYRFEGLVLILFFVIFLYYIFELSRRDKSLISDEIKTEESIGLLKSIGLITIGFIALYFGGKFTVDGAIKIARIVGMSEYFISLTIISIGTSLPELITSIQATLKNKIDIAVGNIIGSNIFNIFWVIGISSVIRPIKIPNSVNFDLIFLLFLTLLFFIFMFIGKKHQLKRWQGAIFFIMYLFYLGFLYYRG